MFTNIARKGTEFTNVGQASSPSAAKEVVAQWAATNLSVERGAATVETTVAVTSRPAATPAEVAGACVGLLFVVKTRTGQVGVVEVTGTARQIFTKACQAFGVDREPVSKAATVWMTPADAAYEDGRRRLPVITPWARTALKAARETRRTSEVKESGLMARALAAAGVDVEAGKAAQVEEAFADLRAAKLILPTWATGSGSWAVFGAASPKAAGVPLAFVVNGDIHARGSAKYAELLAKAKATPARREGRKAAAKATTAEAPAAS